MPIYRAFGYVSSGAAQAAASRAIDDLTSDLLTAARAIVPTAEGAPITDAVVEDIEALPTDPNYSKVTWRFSTPDGRADQIQSVLSTTEATAITTPVTGHITVSSLEDSTARVYLRKVSSIIGTSSGAWAVESGAKFTDTASGKVYQTSARTPASGTSPDIAVKLDVVEVDATQIGNPSYGTSILANESIGNVSAYFRVSRFVTGTVGASTQLRSRITGKLYRVHNRIADPAIVATPAYLCVAGDETGTFGFRRDPADPLLLTDPAPAALNEELEFVTPYSNVRPIFYVDSVVSVVVPKDTGLQSTNARRYLVSADTTVAEALDVTVPIRAVERGGTSDLNVSDTLTFETPLAGLYSTATVSASVDWNENPIEYGAQVVGQGIEWGSRVYRERDGRWVAEVYSEPPGS